MEAGVSFVPACSGLTFSCSAHIVNGLVGQGCLLVAGAADVPGCLKCIMPLTYCKSSLQGVL